MTLELRIYQLEKQNRMIKRILMMLIIVSCGVVSHIEQVHFGKNLFILFGV